MVYQERADMLATMSHMELQIKDMDSMLVEMHKKVEIAVTQSQEAVLEKERLALKEEQALKDVKRLEDKLRLTLQRHQGQIKSEVDAYES
jgi:hypothetical protein